ncbi:hypothetical protein ATZ36_06065 [Candidatus Endomicrobiellum trichonymphae]|uniref:Uncharacterized protein n=1 Tax=Endomicrobium trichonymphae TaxID=1408204 RepID=A0A1E5IJI2_ENDTX|nr:hypothetical protein ATZ36_06065 [Candidatus Endomicrobium trichonymphae]
MRKLTIIYIIFVFLLTSFTGCTKFRETTRDFQKPPQHSDSSDAASIVNNKESWSEWTSRQWNENSQKWIVGTVVVVAAVAAAVVIYKKLWHKKEESLVENPENNIPIDNSVVEQVEEEDHQEPEQQFDANPHLNMPENGPTLGIVKQEPIDIPLNGEFVPKADFSMLERTVNDIIDTLNFNLRLAGNIIEYMKYTPIKIKPDMPSSPAATPPELVDSFGNILQKIVNNYNFFKTDLERQELTEFTHLSFENMRGLISRSPELDIESRNYLREFSNELAAKAEMPLTDEWE